MRDTYSLYEAKAKLSAIIRQVREGRPVVVTLHGEPVAEIRSISPRPGASVLEWSSWRNAASSFALRRPVLPRGQ